MGMALIKLKIMPTSPDVDLDQIKEKIRAKITQEQGEVRRFEEEPIAFGLKAIIAFIQIDEQIDTSKIEDAPKDIENVSSSEIVDYRRAL